VELRAKLAIAPVGRALPDWRRFVAGREPKNTEMTAQFVHALYADFDLLSLRYREHIVTCSDALALHPVAVGNWLRC
jgi:hypothetical protein